MEKKDYLTLIRKFDFTDLFKFGYLFIDTTRIVEFDGNVEDLVWNESVRDKVFKRPNPFDYTFSVLLVHFTNDHADDGRLNIEEVQHIFALDDNAKKEIEISYDPRIRINKPIWPTAAFDLQKHFFIEDAKKGVRNIWKIFNIEKPVSEVENILSEESLSEIVCEVLRDKRPEGDLSFWVYLMRYERHGYFPKTAIGWIMDLINVFINKCSKKECLAEKIEGTEIYKWLQADNLKLRELNTADLIKQLEESEVGRNFFGKINDFAKESFTPKRNEHFCETKDSIQGGFKFHVIAILFLVFKDKIVKDSNLSIDNNEIIEYGRKTFPEEVDYALYLLGIFLGNNHTYEYLYDKLPLPVFKSKPTKVKKREGCRRPVKENANDDYPNGTGTSTYEPELFQEPELSCLPKYVRFPNTKGNNKGRKKIKSRE